MISLYISSKELRLTDRNFGGSKIKTINSFSIELEGDICLRIQNVEREFNEMVCLVFSGKLLIPGMLFSASSDPLLITKSSMFVETGIPTRAALELLILRFLKYLPSDFDLNSLIFDSGLKSLQETEDRSWDMLSNSIRRKILKNLIKQLAAQIVVVDDFFIQGLNFNFDYENLNDFWRSSIFISVGNSTLKTSRFLRKEIISI